MKHYITNEEWNKLDKLLIEMEIPYSISFDSHIDFSTGFITYNKRIIINPIIIETKMKYEEEE